MSKNLVLSSRVCEINKKQDYSSLITIYYINYILRFSEQIKSFKDSNSLNLTDNFETAYFGALAIFSPKSDTTLLASALLVHLGLNKPNFRQ